MLVSIPLFWSYGAVNALPATFTHGATMVIQSRFEPGGAGTGVSAAAGYFYMAAYTPDMLRVTPRPVDGRAKLAD